uniref:Roundabout homolog 2 n=1 Tax=Homo sapiens TaxID=9606 RepID=UPI00017532F8|nr:Chain A, Roundabout homolog 2 [Homo sapiens]
GSSGSSGPPIILQGPANQTLAVDGTALLKCKATGDPLPVISWLKEGFTFPGRDPRATIQEQGTLQIKNLRISDTGTYTCVATSSSGETSWSAVLDVTESG